MTQQEREKVTAWVHALPDESAIKRLVLQLEGQSEFGAETAARLAYELVDAQDQIAALTAQNAALVTALFAVIDQIERDVENSLNPYGPTAAQAREALSLTPTEALERAERDAEERRLLEAALKDWARLYADTDARTSHRWPPEIRKLLEVYDNFRKGAGR